MAPLYYGDMYLLNVGTAITAGTTHTQAGATLLTKDVNVVETCAVADDGVKLPTAKTGRQVIVMNMGAQDCAVWPNTDDAILPGVANAVGPSLATGVEALFIAISDVSWVHVVFA